LTKFCDDIDYKDTCLIIGTGGNANIKISNNFSCSTDNFIIKNKDNQIINNYLYYWFINNMTKLQDCFHGSTIKHISKGDLENIKIPIPPLSSQEYIVTECEYYDNLIDTLKKENERLQNNKIIETVLKSVSNDNQLEESKEKESDEELTKVVEKDKPTKESKSKLKN
jgi:type I restriction enzyme S subunit